MDMPLASVAEGEYRMVVPWCGRSSTSNMGTEKLGVQSDAAPTSDWPGLFIGPATDAALTGKLGRR